MKPTQRFYNSEIDLGVVLALRQSCTTPQNIYDTPTPSDLRPLLAPIQGFCSLYLLRTETKREW